MSNIINKNPGVQQKMWDIASLERGRKSRPDGIFRGVYKYSNNYYPQYYPGFSKTISFSKTTAFRGAIPNMFVALAFSSVKR